MAAKGMIAILMMQMMLMTTTGIDPGKSFVLPPPVTGNVTDHACSRELNTEDQMMVTIMDGHSLCKMTVGNIIQQMMDG